MYKKLLIILGILAFGTIAIAAPIYRVERSILPEVDSTYFLGTTTPSTNAWKGIITDNSTTTNATTTSLGVLNLTAASCDVKSTTGGVIYCGTDATGAGGAFAWTPTTNFNQAANATTTQIWFQGSPISLSASSTSQFDNLVVINATSTNATSTNLYVSGQAGIGIAPSAAILSVVGSVNPEIRLGETDLASYLSIQQHGPTRSQISSVNNGAGVALIDFDPLPSDNVSNSSFRFFRTTNTSGQTSFTVYKGDGTATAQHFFRGNGSSYMQNAAGNLGIGTTSPYAKLSVVGETVARNFTATSSAATSTLPNLEATQLLIGGDYLTELVGTGLQISGHALQTTLGTEITVGELSSADFGDWTCNGTVCSIDADSVALTTDTTGNYAAGDAEAGNVASDKVIEGSLKAVDAAVDEECLTYETTTGDFEWQTCGAGAAADWQKELNFNALALTPTTTIPIWAKAAIYASSSLQVVATTTLMATTTVGANFQVNKANGTAILEILPATTTFSNVTAVGIGVAAPAALFVVAPPAAETIVAAATITANACGTMKQITSTGAVVTSITDTFTAPATANSGCIMVVCNVGVNSITLDNNAKFKASGQDGATPGDTVLGTDDCVEVASNGTAWWQIGRASLN